MQVREVTAALTVTGGTAVCKAHKLSYIEYTIFLAK